MVNNPLNTLFRGLVEGKKNMSEQEKIQILIDYIINTIHFCPLKDESDIDFEKECVGFGEKGCGECILKHLDKLDC